jgi:hypothetical protein
MIDLAGYAAVTAQSTTMEHAVCVHIPRATLWTRHSMIVSGRPVPEDDLRTGFVQGRMG